MRINQLKKLLSEGKTVYGTMVVDWRSPGIAQIFALAGFDFMFIDMEHSPFSTETMADMIRAARLSGIVPLVRPSDHAYFLISRALDAGAQGLMVPRVETPEQAAEVVSCAKYPPEGRRGCALSMAHTDYGAVDRKEYVSRANDEVLLILQIESRRAVESVDERAAAEGVDALLVGPADLSLSYGLPGETTHPTVVGAIDRVLKTALERGIHCGIHLGNVDELIRWKEKGMRIISYSTDISMMKEASRRGLERLKG